MTSGPNPGRRKRIWLQGAIGAAILAVFIFAAWYLTSARFKGYIRARLISRLEEVTGGRVELKSLTWNLVRLEFDFRDVTVHGREAPGQPPYAHVDRIYVRAKIGVLFRPKLGFRYLEIDRPVVHVLVYPDGTTNQPAPRLTAPAALPIEKLFDLAINRAEIRDGELTLNDRKISLNFAADNLSTTMSYAVQPKRYDGSVRVESVETRYRKVLPFGSTAEVQFSILPAAIDVKQARWSAGKSSAAASGRITEFSNPRVELTYTAGLNLAQFAGAIPDPRLRNGRLELSGQGTYAGGDFASSGALLLRDFDYLHPDLRVRNASLDAKYSVTKDRLQLSQIVARMLGGTVAGEVKVRNWMSASSDRISPPEGAAQLRIQNVSMAALAAAASSRSLPVAQLRPVGAATGTLNARWRGAPSDAEATISLQVVPTSNPAQNQLPITAHLQADYLGNRSELRVADLRLATRATRLSASGVLGRTSGDLKVAASTSSLQELQPVLTAFHGPSHVPVELAGKASFNGTVRGSFSAPAIAGHLQATNFETAIALPSANHETPVRRTHWDLLSTDVLYSSKMGAARNALLRSGKAELKFDVSAGLQQGQFTDTSPISAHVLIQNGDIGDLQALAGYNFPIAGTVNANLALGGSQRDLRGSARILATNAVAYGEPISSLTADVIFANRTAQANNINLAHNGARVTGTAGYNLATQEFRFDLRGSNFDLARVRLVQTPRFSVAGMMNFAVRGSGTKEAPTIDGKVQLTNLVLAGEKVGDLTADAATSGTEMKVTARSNIENADLHADGTIHLRDDFPANFNVRFTHLDFDPLLRAYLKGRVTGHSAMAGVLELRGPLRRPRDMNISGAVEQLSANLENVSIQNDGPIRFSMAEETVKLERLRLTGEGTSVSAAGTAQIVPPYRLDLRSDGEVNLKLLQTYNANLTSSGTLNFAVNIGGPMSNPQVQGQAQVLNASISHSDLPNGLSDANGLLVFNRDRLAVQSFTAKTGGGTLSVGGFLTYGRAVTFNLSATGRDVRLRYPPGISSVANVNLTLTGSLKNGNLAGDIVVTKFGVNPQFDFATYLARAKQPTEAVRPDSWLNNLHLDVHVSSTPELEVKTSLAKLSGDADLRLRGVATKPSVLGRVNIVEGDIFFNGTRYHMERGDITFTNPVRIEPVLDIEATARVKEYDVTLGFHGPLDRLKTTYRSDPPLPTADIIALLALGHTREESAAAQTQPQSSFSESASYAMLGEALNAAVSSRVQRIFGVSRIKIDPQAATEAGSTYTGPQLSIEQQVNNNITLTYITNLSQGNQQTIQLQYDINRNVSVVAIRDDLTGVVSFDVRVRQRKK